MRLECVDSSPRCCRPCKWFFMLRLYTKCLSLLRGNCSNHVRRMVRSSWNCCRGECCRCVAADDSKLAANCYIISTEIQPFPSCTRAWPSLSWGDVDSQTFIQVLKSRNTLRNTQLVLSAADISRKNQGHLTIDYTKVAYLDNVPSTNPESNPLSVHEISIYCQSTLLLNLHPFCNVGVEPPSVHCIYCVQVYQCSVALCMEGAAGALIFFC